jgi:hypothetical protein
LIIENLDILDEAFSLTPLPTLPIEILPNDSLWIKIGFSPLEEQFYSSSFIITSDDSEMSIVTINLKGFGKEISPILHNPYPNPFSKNVNINFDLPVAAQVTLQIYDITGKLIITLVTKKEDVGYHSIIWDGKNEKGMSVESSVYIYKLTADNGFTETKRMILLK